MDVEYFTTQDAKHGFDKELNFTRQLLDLIHILIFVPICK